MLQRIIKFAKQLYSVKYSTSLEKCVGVAIEQEIGNDALSKYLRALGITKQEYISYILSKMGD